MKSEKFMFLRITLCKVCNYFFCIQIILLENLLMLKSFPKQKVNTLKYSDIAISVVIKSFPKRNLCKIIGICLCLYVINYL